MAQNLHLLAALVLLKGLQGIMCVMIVTSFCVAVGGSEPSPAGGLGAAERTAGYHVPHAGHHPGAAGLGQTAGRRWRSAQSQRCSTGTQQTGIRQKVNFIFLLIVCIIHVFLLMISLCDLCLPPHYLCNSCLPPHDQFV